MKNTKSKKVQAVEFLPGKTKGVKVEFEPLSDSEIHALREFAELHGKAWKEELSARWMRASAGPTLHRLRNSHGPAWLVSFTLPEADCTHPASAIVGGDTTSCRRCGVVLQYPGKK